MTSPEKTAAPVGLRLALVVGVTEDACSVWSGADVVTVRFAAPFPSPRVERVSPGHLAAIASAADGREAVVWRWYDAVVVGDEGAAGVRLWEPGHGEVMARPTAHHVPGTPGGRAYASAGLPGAEWWVSGPVVAAPQQAAVEVEAVRALYDEHEMWGAVFPIEPA